MIIDRLDMGRRARHRDENILDHLEIEIMMLSGIVGLFLGAVVLALGYEILVAWMETDELNNPRQAPEEADADPA